MADISNTQPPEPPIRIELGRGRFDGWEWELVYWLNIPHGPLVMFGSSDGHGGQNPSENLEGPFGRTGHGLQDDGSNTVHWLHGEVQAGFDCVLIEGDDGTTVEAEVVNCESRLGFNFYVAVTRSRPVSVTASSPRGDTTERSWAG